MLLQDFMPYFHKNRRFFLLVTISIRIDVSFYWLRCIPQRSTNEKVKKNRRFYLCPLPSLVVLMQGIFIDDQNAFS